jgi:RNA polymerase sigma-70 factor, ECF subfamily
MPDTALSLLEQLRQGDSPDRWAYFVDVYTPLLRGWLRRYEDLSSADAEDMVQEVLMTVSQELANFQHNQQPGAFRAWLRRILVNRLRIFWRSRQRQPQAVGGSDYLAHLHELEDDASGISAQWDREHDLHVMRHLLELVKTRVAPQTWQAFRQQVILEKEPEEVALELGLSANSVYVAKSRVLRALRKAAEGLV